MFAERVISFNKSLDFKAPLPHGIGVMNPFHDNACAAEACAAFYGKYYDDNDERHAIFGINPGRFGAGLTGVPFTDPKRLRENCGIAAPACPSAHEPSSQFVYEAIGACGGPEKFYKKWYINSLCPLGFTKISKSGKPVNYNYYDSPELLRIATPFILKTLREQIAIGLRTDVCVCFGRGKNAAFFNKINAENHFFGKIVALDHPRYIIQYKTREIPSYIEKYRETFEMYG